MQVGGLGKAGADTFRIVTADGHGPFGVVDRGNIIIEAVGC